MKPLGNERAGASEFIKMQNEKSKIIIDKLQFGEVNEFFQVFSQIISNDFPGYSKAVIDYFLTQVYTINNFQQWLLTGWKIVLLAKQEALIVGFAVLDRPYGGVCFCRWVGVLPEYRKKGIGRELMREWEEFGRECGCHKLEVAGQPTAKKFYQKAGLKLEGKRKLSYFGIDQFIFGKVIGEPKDEVMAKD